MGRTIFFTHTPVRWGIIGCGNVTEVKSGPPYSITPGFELTMVMRRDKAKLVDYATRHAIPNYTTDASELIHSNLVDAVYIATPPDTHKKYALMVAEAGKPCCIEKPMTPSYAESLSIYQAFNEKQLPLYVAYYRRSLPRFLKIKEWLDAGLIGTIRQITWHKSRTPSPTDTSKIPNWRTEARVAPGGYFDDLASHGLDLFAFLLGEIVTANGLANNQQGLYTSKDAIVGNWMHKNGVMGSGVWNFGLNTAQDEVVIYGSEGEIRFAVLDEAPITISANIIEESLEIPHPKHVQEFHVLNMKKDLFGIQDHPSSGQTALRTSWVMDAILGNL